MWNLPSIQEHESPNLLDKNMNFTGSGLNKFFKPQSNTSLRKKGGERLYVTLKQLHEEIIGDNSSTTSSSESENEKSTKDKTKVGPTPPPKFRRNLGIENLAIKSHRKRALFKNPNAVSSISKVHDFETINFDQENSVGNSIESQ
jgi:hypothetical protein